jgi:hypothetical protein
LEADLRALVGEVGQCGSGALDGRVALALRGELQAGGSGIGLAGIGEGGQWRRGPR